MNARKFVKGDVVKLKSGSPRMTVRESFDDDIDCVWFCEGKLERGKFFAIELFLPPPPRPPTP